MNTNLLPQLELFIKNKVLFVMLFNPVHKHHLDVTQNARKKKCLPIHFDGLLLLFVLHFFPDSIENVYVYTTHATTTATDKKNTEKIKHSISVNVAFAFAFAVNKLSIGITVNEMN